MKLTSTLTVAGLLLVATATAQTAYVFDVTTSTTIPMYLPTAAYPGGGAAPIPPLPLPGASLFSGVPATFVPPGGHAIDQVTRTVYSTDGLQLVTEPHPLYSTGGVVSPPVPVFGALLSGGPITGLAVDARNGILYMCDSMSWGAFSTTFPYPPLSPPVAPAFLHQPFSGIGFDASAGAILPAGGTLFLCDISGGVYHAAASTGVGIGAQPINVVGPTLDPVSGLTVNTTNGAGAFPAPGCSTQLPGYHVVLTDGVNVFDALNNLSPPIPIPPTITTHLAKVGMAFSSDGQITPGAPATCTAEIGLRRPAWVGMGPPPTCDLFLRNATPFVTATFIFMLCPGGPTPVPWGGTLCIGSLVSPVPLSTIGVATNAAGNAFVTLPTGIAPAGVQFTATWIYPDPTNSPFGVCHTDCLTTTFGLP